MTKQHRTRGPEAVVVSETAAGTPEMTRQIEEARASLVATRRELGRLKKKLTEAEELHQSVERARDSQRWAVGVVRAEIREAIEKARKESA